MAGSLKPQGVGVEAKIHILGTQNRDHIDAGKLVNEKIDTDHYNNALLLFLPSDYVDFRIDLKANVWAIGGRYSDGGGITGKSVRLYQKTSDAYVLVGVYETKDNGTWYKLFDELHVGTYRMYVTGCYVGIRELYGEAQIQFLYEQNNITYGMKEGE